MNYTEKDILIAILNEIIPEDKARGLPGAGTLNTNRPDILSEKYKVKDLIRDIDETIKSKSMTSKNELKILINTQLKSLKKTSFRMYNSLIISVFEVYYSAPEILEIISVLSVPPYPEGKFIEESDLLIFEDVFIRGKIYKD